MKAKSLIKISPKERVKVEALQKFVGRKGLKNSGLRLPKNFKAAVLISKDNSPKYFVFDVSSLWELFCLFDETFEKIASAQTYASRNPFGWMIDAIESALPLNPKFLRRLKKGLSEAERLGVVPFAIVKRRLGLA